MQYFAAILSIESNSYFTCPKGIWRIAEADHAGRFGRWRFLRLEEEYTKDTFALRSGALRTRSRSPMAIWANSPGQRAQC